MRLVETKVFTLDELSDQAKSNARDWYRAASDDYDWWDSVYEDFTMIAEILGITLKKRDIQFSGFSSPGDGACFEGSYAYKPGASLAIASYAPLDKTLHSIARTLQKIQRPYFYKLETKIAYRGNYYHEFCMDIDEPLLAEPLRDLARWLRDQHDYLNSDPSVDEMILCNEYTFTEEGKRFG